MKTPMLKEGDVVQVRPDHLFGLAFIMVTRLKSNEIEGYIINQRTQFNVTMKFKDIKRVGKSPWMSFSLPATTLHT